MTESREYLRAGDIARLVGVSERTVRRWIATGELPSVKIAGTRLVATACLECPPSQAIDVAEELKNENE
jgi:excisionase family DNA binding protein